MDKINWSQKVKEALDRTEFLALSTMSDGETWTNPLAFAYDGKINLYFISMMDSKHTQNILKNSNVSIAIFKTERFASGDVLGLQLRGVTNHLTDVEEIQQAAECYFSRGGNEEFRDKTSEKRGATATWQFFKVTPSELWYFDSRIFGDDRVQVPLDDIDFNKI